MIVAQYKCGCSLHQDNTPNCLQCCSASRAPPEPQTFSENCWRDKFPKQPRRSNDDYNFAGGNECCPGHSDYEEDEPGRQIESEIEARRTPYKELEAIINENRIVLRMQVEPPPIVFDPPCDCLDDEQTAGQNSPGFCGTGGDNDDTGVRTFVVYSDAKSPTETDGRKHHKHENKRDSIKPGPPVVHDFEENPNIFLLRIRKQGGNNDRKNNVDLEFRTPRPWSQKMKALAEAEAKEVKARAKEVRTAIRAETKKKKKKKKKSK